MIPTEATLKLKLHAESEEVHQTLIDSIETISNGIASSFDVDASMMPDIKRKGFASVVVNSEALVLRSRELMGSADFVPGLVNDHTVAGSDDAFILVQGLENTQKAYFFVGTAEPKVFEAAWAEGRFPFFVHETFLRC